MARTNRADELKATADLLKRPGAAGASQPFGSDRPRPTNARLANIDLDPNQPRKDPGDISDLVASIREHGLIQPLVIEPVDSTRYRLIAGERRYRACQQAGLDVVPVIVRTVKDQQRLELQLIENLHRKDLDAFEEAAGYQRLADEFNLTQAHVAERMGKSRTHVTQTLSLARIPEEVRAKCQSSDIALSRDTLYLIAKQPTPAKMLEVLQDAQTGRPIEERRARARKGEARETTPKKPKQVFSTEQNATVIVQSLTTRLTKPQTIEALKEALKKAKG